MSDKLKAIAVWLMFSYVAGMSQMSAVSPQMRTSEGNHGPEMIATRFFKVGGETRALTLWRQEIRPLNSFEIQEYFSAHRNETSFPNTAFIIVSSSTQNLSSGDIVWATYAYHNLAIMPPELWSADLAVSGATAYVAISRSISIHVSFGIYDFDPTRKLGSFPIKLDPKQYDQWPPAAQPLARSKKALLSKEISGISAIRLVSERSQLLIIGERETTQSWDFFTRFNPNNKQWTNLFLAQGDVEEEGP
jgi:hypothetical protein